MRASQRSYEKIVLPFRHQGAGVKGHPTRCNGGIPIINRLIHAGLLCPVADNCPAVFKAVSNLWPSVIMSGLNQIEFIAGLWPMFRFPQLTRLEIDRKSLWVTMS